MKVLITTEWNMPVINGVVVSVNNLKEELTKLGHDVRILTLSSTQQSSTKDGVVSLASLSAGKIYPGARVAIPIGNKYIKEIIKWKPDIIHSQSEFSTFLLARYLSRRLDIPIVHTYHTVYENYTHYFSPVEKWGKTMASLFTTSTLRHTSCVIAPTEKVRNLLGDYGVTKEIEVVPTGIRGSQSAGNSSNKMKQSIKKKIELDEKKRTLIVVGRLAKEKNIEEILYYFSKLDNLNLQMLIVGDGPHRAQLEKIVEQYGISDLVYFTGMIPHDKINQYYQIADVFVSASNSETQGLTYLEALTNGLPSLCRKDACLDDVIRNGENGWQYESFEQFRDQLNLILEDSEVYQSLSANARALAEKEYSISTFGLRVDQIYRDTIRIYRKKHALPMSSVVGYTW